MSQWISCKEKNPEKDELVLVFRPDAAQYYDPLVRTAKFTGEHYACYVQPSHWMRIPEYPEIQK